MKFNKYFPALELFAQEKIGHTGSGITTTKELASTLGLKLDQSVGAYEAYNREDSKKFEFKREFQRRDIDFAWHVTIERL